MCLFPFSASLPPEGGRPKLDFEGDLKLPCGKCNECISKRAIEWATRAKHEISENNENCFITLTYNEENLPSNFIIKSDFQKFIKKLRKQLNTKFKYMVSYEYGTKNFRPHMHAIIFGYNPPNQKLQKVSKKGYNLYTSPKIEQLWGKGFHSIAEANEKTAYYIASYALKGQEKSLYHPKTGEWCTLKDTMDVSKRPAIGLNYLLKNYQQLVDTKTSLPRYYAKKLEQYHPELFEEYQNNLQSLIKNRDSGEKYAKFIIDNQKINLGTSTYREGNTTNKEIARSNFYKERLKSNRDDYVTYNRRKKNELIHSTRPSEQHIYPTVLNENRKRRN